MKKLLLCLCLLTMSFAVFASEPEKSVPQNNSSKRGYEWRHGSFQACGQTWNYSVRVYYDPYVAYNAYLSQIQKAAILESKAKNTCGTGVTVVYGADIEDYGNPEGLDYPGLPIEVPGDEDPR